MLIVPRSDVLVVEARVAPKDVDQIRLGQDATLRFTAFNQRTTPEIAGQVTLVGADQVSDEKAGTSYFKVHIATQPDERERTLRLVPGMPVEAFIRTGERTVLSYLTKPLNDQASRAFRED